MELLVTGNQMKKLDTFTIQEMGVPSLVLMERAGLAVYDEMLRKGFPLTRTLVLCGGGNNGADGVVIARLLFLAGYDVDVCILGNPGHFTEEMKKQIDIGKNYGISFVKTFIPNEYTTIVDAVLGVGLSREVSGKYKDAILLINDCQGKVVSVDIPSGISADTGAVLGAAVKADLTVTFGYRKAGLCFYPGAAYAGKIIVADVGIYKDKRAVLKPELCACTFQDLQKLKRLPEGNKGSFGKIFLVAGSRDIFGAAYLSGYGAMKTGAGMLKVCTARENRQMFSCFPEAMLQVYDENTDLEAMMKEGMDWADVYGIGPGIGTGPLAEALLEILLANGKKPLVIDADGINLLRERKELLKNYPGGTILTPHLGEFSRLTGVSVEEWKKNPIEITGKTAEELHTVLICKDARTVIAENQEKVCINLSGNDGMATAGSGDVLTGILLSVLAQRKGELFGSACLGVYLHGVAGDLAAEKKGRAGMLAKDIAQAAASILNEL